MVNFSSPDATPGDPPSNMTLAEVAAHLRSCSRTITRLYRSGKFPTPFRVGPRLLWDRSEVIAWLAAQREPIHAA